MKNYTINEVVRRSLGLHGLSNHYYMDFLQIALQGARKINLETMPNVKAVSLPIGSGDTVDLPDDCIDVLTVGVEIGDKVRPFGKNYSLNDRDNSDEPFGEIDASGLNSGAFQAEFYNNYFSKYGDILGKMYGLGVSWTDEYRVLRSQGKIRISNKTDASTVHLTYVAEPETLNGETLVHPYAEQTLIDYIAWQYSNYRDKNRFDTAQKRKDFYNSYRILRAKRWNLTVTDLKRVMRKNNKMSPKS